jgi:peptide deformylase
MDNAATAEISPPPDVEATATAAETTTIICPILFWRPGHPVLSARTLPVDFGREEAMEHQALLRYMLTELLEALTATMYACTRPRSIGLAAPQIGVGLRVAVLDLATIAKEAGAPPPPQSVLELVNPRFVAGEKRRRLNESCLSLPTLDTKVDRFEEVTVAYEDRHGVSHEAKATKLFAQALQHELDHLDGRTIAERCGSGARGLLYSQLKKIRRTQFRGADAYLPGARA